MVPPLRLIMNVFPWFGLFSRREPDSLRWRRDALARGSVKGRDERPFGPPLTDPSPCVLRSTAPSRDEPGGLRSTGPATRIPYGKRLGGMVLGGAAVDSSPPCATAQNFLFPFGMNVLQ